MLKAGTRQLLRKNKSLKGRLPLSISLMRYQKGDTVVLKIRTEQIENAPNRPYGGMIGKIVQVYGRICKVKIGRKIIVTSSVHVSKIKD